MAAGDPIAADQQRSEITPTPWSAREGWDLDTNAQEALSNYLFQWPQFISVLQEYALAVVPKPGFSEAYCAGVQEGGRNLIEKILNMTKERLTHKAGRDLEKKNAQLGAGLPKGKQLRPSEIPASRRLTGPIPPKETPPQPQ